MFWEKCLLTVWYSSEFWTDISNQQLRFGFVLNKLKQSGLIQVTIDCGLVQFYDSKTTLNVDEEDVAKFQTEQTRVVCPWYLYSISLCIQDSD